MRIKGLQRQQPSDPHPREPYFLQPPTEGRVSPNETYQGGGGVWNRGSKAPLPQNSKFSGALNETNTEAIRMHC